MPGPRSIKVLFQTSSYTVTVTDGNFEDMDFASLRLNDSDQAFIITDNFVAELYGNDLEKLIRPLCPTVTWARLSPGEQSKTLETVNDLYLQASMSGLSKRSLVIALGGGVVQDIATYFSATFLRGIRLVQIPTSALAQADFSFGGCAFNAFGRKSVLGTFYQPAYVHIGLGFLKTHTPHQIACGLAEVVNKVLCLAGLRKKTLNEDLLAARQGDQQTLRDLVQESFHVKRRIIESDETGLIGKRRVLEWGHTVAHALEQVAKFTLNHGEALAIGMAAEARLSWALGFMTQKELDSILGTIDTLGIASSLPPGIRPEEIVRSCDKLDRNGNFLKGVVILERPGKTTKPTEVAATMLLDCLNHLHPDRVTTTRSRKGGVA